MATISKELAGILIRQDGHYSGDPQAYAVLTCQAPYTGLGVSFDDIVHVLCYDHAAYERTYSELTVLSEVVFQGPLQGSGTVFTQNDIQEYVGYCKECQTKYTFSAPSFLKELDCFSLCEVCHAT